MSQTMKVTIPVEGMSCQHCVNSVTEALARLSGVKEVKVDLKGGLAVISGENLDSGALRNAIEEIGFTAGPAR